LGPFQSAERSVIPDEESAPRAGTTFPYVPLAVGVLVLHAVLAVTYPKTLLRSVLAIASFFGMGYCVLALISGGRIPMSAAEILAFTVGLTVLVTSLSALAVSIIGIPITEFAVVILGLPIGFLTLLLRHPARHPWTTTAGFLRRWLGFSEYSITEKRIAALLFAGILGALAAWVALSAVPYPNPSSMAIAISGLDGKVESLPTSFERGKAQTIVVYVLANATPAWPDGGAGSFTLRIRMVPANATGTEPFHRVPTASPIQLDAFGESSETIAVAPQSSWSKPFLISIAPGVVPCPTSPAPCYILRFELLGAAGNVISKSLAPIFVT
jgi:hypothetical protein